MSDMIMIKGESITNLYQSQKDIETICVSCVAVCAYDGRQKNY